MLDRFTLFNLEGALWVCLGTPQNEVLWGEEEPTECGELWAKDRSEQHGVCSDDGGLAQLGERLPCKQEVSGSIPLISTKPEWSQRDGPIAQLARAHD